MLSSLFMVEAITCDLVVDGHHLHDTVLGGHGIGYRDAQYSPYECIFEGKEDLIGSHQRRKGGLRVCELSGQRQLGFCLWLEMISRLLGASVIFYITLL